MSPVWLMDTKGTLSSLYPPCDIVMSHFSQHRKDDGIWYSRPFYSAPHGYKLCLCIVANGYGEGAGTRVSVSIFLMKGENDHQLQWPFEHDVTYRILNWKRDADHVTQTIPFKDVRPEIKGRVTTSKMAPSGPVHAQALSHSLLCGSKNEDVQYLIEDCLCVQVLKVQPPK